MNEHDVEQFTEDDDNDAPRAFTSDEEREQAALDAVDDAAEQTELPPPPVDDVEAEVMSWADAKAEATEIAEAKKPKRHQRTTTIAGVERALNDGELSSQALVDCAIGHTRRIEMVQEVGLLLDDKRAKETSLKEHVKIAKGEIADLERRARDLVRGASTGVEVRLLDVATLRDDRRGDMVMVRCDSGEEVKRWPQTFSERQAALPGVTLDPHAVDASAIAVEDIPAPKARRRRKNANGAAVARAS